MKKSRIQLGLIIILIIMAVSLLFSQKANPNQKLLFGLKRVQEKIFLKTKITPQAKVDYMSNLLEIRLQEIQNVVNNKSYFYLLYSSLRYSTLAGQITDLIIESKMTDKLEVVKDQFLTHQKILNDLYVAYPKNTSNLEYKYIQDDYNYLKLYLDKLAEVK